MDQDRAGRSLRALLVDDDPATSPIHAERLTKRGYHVTASANADEALGLARRSPPDVVFVHLGSKGWGGSSFIQGLRSDDVTRHVPVVILSSEYDLKLKKLGLATHADGFW